MTEKDYELVADSIRRILLYDGGDLNTLKCLAHSLAQNFQAAYADFDTYKFMEACGVILLENSGILSK